MTTEERKLRDRAILFGHINGDNPKILRKRYGLSNTQIYRILRSQGVKTKENKKQIINRIIELDQKGKSEDEIAEETGVIRKNVNATLRSNGYRWIPKGLNCTICGTTFTQWVKSQICCSDECSAENKRRYNHLYNKKDIFIWKNCGFCGKPYKVHHRSKNRQRFCNRSCGSFHRYRENKIRDKEIFYLRDVQCLTFVRIGEIFSIASHTAGQIYRKQLAINNLARAERLAELGVTGDD